jgi:surface protein
MLDSLKRSRVKQPLSRHTFNIPEQQQQNINKMKMMNMMVTMVTDDIQALYQQCFYQDDGALLVNILSFLDVKTLEQLESVNKAWQELCKKTIHGKCGDNGPKAFECDDELRRAVVHYCFKKYIKYDAAQMEKIASTYGYPINTWDVSQIHDMSGIFRDMDTFNETIGSWDVSNVETMCYMFFNAKAFNQDIGAWDVSNVTNMACMFNGASVFNQDIGCWNVSNVTSMSYMFRGATAFNQNVGSWDVSSVLKLYHTFESACNFNQDIGSWDVSRVEGMSSMFLGAAAFNQDLRRWNVSAVADYTTVFGASSSQNRDAVPTAWHNPNDFHFLFSDEVYLSSTECD